VSQLKKHIGPKVVPQGNLPLVTPDGYIKLQYVAVLDTRSLPRGDDIITQWKVHWQNLTKDQATREDKLFNIYLSRVLPSDNQIVVADQQFLWTRTCSRGRELSEPEEWRWVTSS
jgi:hypothetical protein